MAIKLVSNDVANPSLRSSATTHASSQAAGAPTYGGSGGAAMPVATAVPSTVPMASPSAPVAAAAAVPASGYAAAGARANDPPPTYEVRTRGRLPSLCGDGGRLVRRLWAVMSPLAAEGVQGGVVCLDLVHVDQFGARCRPSSRSVGSTPIAW